MECHQNTNSRTHGLAPYRRAPWRRASILSSQDGRLARRGVRCAKKSAEDGQPTIVLDTANGKHWYPKNKGVGQTWLFRPASGQKTKLADFPFGGGLSLDGTRLTDAYGGCLMKNLITGQASWLGTQQPACNPSMS
ncbi:MAG: hypothetical protein O2857_09715, partial [Planctomycetota bacterium]|nr:hypothetical protein [Planctomycetota bacterium]